MSDTKQKLITLVSALEEENIIDYCYTFIGLKVYGKTKLPDSITAELRQMWNKHLISCGYATGEKIEQEFEQYEPTTEEKASQTYRCDIIRMLCNISDMAILNYIRIIVEDVAKEDKKGGAKA